MGASVSYSANMSGARGYMLVFACNAHTEPATEMTAYEVRIVRRRLLYRDWLYGEIIPRITWEREDDFEPNPSIGVLLEMNFRNHMR